MTNQHFYDTLLVDLIILISGKTYDMFVMHKRMITCDTHNNQKLRMLVVHVTSTIASKKQHVLQNTFFLVQNF